MRHIQWQTFLASFSWGAFRMSTTLLYSTLTSIHLKMPSWQTPFEDLQDIYRKSGYSKVTRTELIKGMGLGFIGYRAGPTFRGSIFRAYGDQVSAGPFISSVQCLSSTTKTIRLVGSTS